ncbi:unnamed protein product [Tilletia caries]|nr:unnamed protein product [Tilletia caries]CAD6968434.1 unnamed protein product [Tilletia controversa]
MTPSPILSSPSSSHPSPWQGTSSSLDLSSHDHLVVFHEDDHLLPLSSSSSSLPLAEKEKTRTTVTRRRWSSLLVSIIVASTLYVVYLNRTLLTANSVSTILYPSPSPIIQAVTPPHLQSEQDQAQAATEALEIPLPVHLYHPPPKVSPFSNFHLDYYALPLEHRRSIKPIASIQPLLAHPQCADQWITNGTLCTNFPTLPPSSIDILYTWVNGSAPHSASRKLYAASTEGWWEEHWRPDPLTEFENRQKRAQPVPSTSASSILKRLKKLSPPTLQGDNGDNRFRDTSELQYSIRSSVKYIHNLANIHIVSPDFAQQPASSQFQRLDKDRFLLPSDLLEYESTDRFRAFPLNGSSRAVRAGQVPSWLNTSRPDVLLGDHAIDPSLHPLDNDTATLRVHHDWSTFTPSWLLKPQSIGTYFTQPQIEQWKHAVLPTFNSMAIEAYLGDQAGLGDVLLSANDDFFLAGHLRAEDVHTPLYGLVLRLQSHLPVIGSESGFLSKWDHVKGGEWPSYRRSAYLLDQRFGRREQGRRYLSHVHKSLHRSLLEESRIMFDRPIREAAGSRFRGSTESVNTPFLAQTFVVERHREALLWTFFMLRHDVDADGFYARESGGEWETLLREMGLGSIYTVRSTEKKEKEKEKEKGESGIEIIHDFATALAFLASGAEDLHIAVPRPRRSSLATSTANLQSSSSDQPFQRDGRGPASGLSTYVFSHLDGYPFLHLGQEARTTPSHHHRRARPAVGVEAWPTYEPKNKNEESLFVYDVKRPACRVELTRRCLRREWVLRGAEVGVGRGEWERGPRAEDVFKRFAFEEVECGDCLIQLLMHNSGRSGTLTNHALLPRRPFAHALLTRYAYTLSDAPIEFVPLSLVRGRYQGSGTNSVGWKLEKLAGARGFVCVNDDVMGVRGGKGGKDVEGGKVQEMVRRFMEMKWPDASPFEHRR